MIRCIDPECWKLLINFSFLFRFYQIRSYIKSATKLPFKFEVSLPKNKGKFFDIEFLLSVLYFRFSLISHFRKLTYFYILFTVSGIAFPACVINGTAVTKTFQILYRNEEVQLGDVVHFRIHGLVEGGKVWQKV